MLIEIAAARSMIGALRSQGARGAWLLLLEEVMRLAGPAALFVDHSEKPWASVTFSGSRHKIALAFEGAAAVEAGEAFIAALPDHKFTVRDHLVADATVTGARHSLVDGPRLAIDAELLVLDEA